jgi:hypothetical protein
MSSCGCAGLSVANPLQPTPKSVADPLQAGRLGSRASSVLIVAAEKP